MSRTKIAKVSDEVLRTTPSRKKLVESRDEHDGVGTVQQPELFSARVEEQKERR